MLVSADLTYTTVGKYKFVLIEELLVSTSRSLYTQSVAKPTVDIHFHVTCWSVSHRNIKTHTLAVAGDLKTKFISHVGKGELS